MEKRKLGKTDVAITSIVLGTWGIGGWMWGGTNEQEAIEAIKTAMDEGVTTIDTAAVYGVGLSERLVGKAIAGQRNKVQIATKCGMRWKGESPKEEEVEITRNSKPESIFYECEQSLKRLNTDVIDLYQIHWPDPETPIEESWEAMAKLKAQGKVRAIGVSNYSFEQLKKAHAVHPVDSTQMPYSLMRRAIEKDILPFCLENQISILAYSSLERGLLTGKVTPEKQFPKGDHRGEYSTFSMENRKKVLVALEKIHPIAKKYNATIAQIIINCTMNMPGITAALVGARNKEEAIENSEAGNLKLSSEEYKIVRDALSAKELQQDLYT